MITQQPQVEFPWSRSKTEGEDISKVWARDGMHRSVGDVTTITPEDIAHAERPSTQMLLAIGRLGKHLYQGTVDPATKAKRRARNKAARAARRVHR